MRVVSLHAGGAGLPKLKQERLELVAGYGALGDRHAGKDPKKAVLITSLEIYRDLAGEGVVLAPGSLGENLLVGGLDVHALPLGARLEVGKVVLELTQVCTVCAQLSAFHRRLPKLAYGRRGVYARVIMGGTVLEGDAVTVSPAFNSLPAKQ